MSEQNGYQAKRTRGQDQEEELRDYRPVHAFNASYSNVDATQKYAVVSVIGPDVPQRPLGEDGKPIDCHGIVVWGCCDSAEGPIADDLKSKAHKACGGQLEVYLIKACAMVPLKFSHDHFTSKNTRWAEDRVNELMKGATKQNELASTLFEDRKKHLQSGTANSEMVWEEVQRLENDLQKMEEEKKTTLENLKAYRSHYHQLKDMGQ